MNLLFFLLFSFMVILTSWGFANPRKTNQIYHCMYTGLYYEYTLYTGIMQYKSEKTLQLISKFGETVKELRAEKTKKSQTMLAYEYDLDSGNLSRIEGGKIDPKLTMLWRLSEALSIPLSEIFRELEKNLGKDFHITDS